MGVPRSKERRSREADDAGGGGGGDMGEPTNLCDGDGGAHDGPQVGPREDQAEGGLGGGDVHGSVDEGPEVAHADAAEGLDRAVGYPP